MSTSSKLNIDEQSTGGPAPEVRADVFRSDETSQDTILRRDNSGAAPLSFAQERLWYLEQIDPGSPAAHLARGLKITGELDQERLRQSLMSVVARHDSLRATFATTQLYAGVDGQPAQLIAPEGKIELNCVDLSGMPASQQSERTRELARAAAQGGFDLTTGPLLRVSLVQLGRQDHLLFVTIHRIISDEQSLSLLFRDLWETYANPGSLPPLPLQFVDYASWQRTVINKEKLSGERNYWSRTLQGCPAVLELTADRPRPAVQDWHGESLTAVLDEELGAALITLSSTEQATLFEIFMAAFRILLARYSRQTDLVIGSEFANRESGRLQDVIGPLANAYPLRVELSGNLTFRELLSRVQQSVRDAARHRLMPFEMLVEELELERSLSFAPIFQVALKLREPRVFPGDLLLEEFDFETGIARLDLALDIISGGSASGESSGAAANNFKLRFEYDSDLFDRETITRMASHFQVLLGAIVRNPEEHVAELPLLTAPESQRILFEWNDTGSVPADPLCVHEIFNEAARRHSHQIALVAGAGRLTYAELNARANQLAHYLQKLGIGPEALVGVYLERSADNIVALLAILKAGGAYVPIDPAYPADRVSFMLSDAAVPVLITQQKLAGNVPQQAAQVVLIDDDWARIAAESTQDPPTRTTPENLAYVIYTSGSTGRPKGVPVMHQTVTHLFAATRERLDLGEGDVWTTVHSSAFDFSVWEIWGALLLGGRLVVVPLEVAQSPNALYELLQQEGVTILNQTPSALRQLLETEPGLAGLSLRTIVCGGDALDRELAASLAALSIPVWNFYGPTESTVWASCTKVEQTSAPDVASHESQTEVGTNSIGRPLSDLETYILDENLQPLPAGVPGEICIGGAGLARGYFNRAALTADRFVPNPFSRTGGQRLYRTGDLGRHLRDGRFEFLARLDNQVKLRGFRIELGEIEAVLTQHPEVHQAVVTIREDQPGNKRLVAYVVPQASLNGAGPSEADLEWSFNLRQLMAAKLPEYMMPSAFVKLDTLPLTANRKVDRKALPKPEDGRRGPEDSYLAPRDNLEQQLVNIWEKILGVKRIGVRASFFALGGNSLLAVRLFAQIENRFGKRLPLSALFQSPTVAELANLLRGPGDARAWSALVAIQPAGSLPPLFCVHAAGANVLIYRPLSRHLGIEQPVYALQARGLDGEQEPLLKVEEMARHYIREMRAFQPEGPYHLLGASFGGLVIFEMAHQLLAQGQQVGLLAMLNTNCPVYPRGRKVRFHLAHLKEYGPAFYSKAIWQTVKRKLGKPTVSVAIDTGPDPALARLVAERHHGDEALVRTVLAILDAEKDYVPRGKIYPGRITLFWAQDAETDSEDNRLGWEKLARGGLEVHVVPGTHISIREEPQVAVLAEKVKHSLCTQKAARQS